MIFQYNYMFNLRTILKLIKFKNLNILDFGCGIGNWNEKNINSNRLKKVTLFDKNKGLEKFLKSKYKSKKIVVNFNIKSIKKNKFFNVLIFSSVIQYISPKKLKKIISDFSKNKSKLVIIITDIPYLPRSIEFLLLPFFNFRRFCFTLNLIFSKKYNKMNYNTFKKKDFHDFKDKFFVRYINNIHDLKFLRYSLVMTLK